MKTPTSIDEGNTRWVGLKCKRCGIVMNLGSYQVTADERVPGPDFPPVQMTCPSCGAVSTYGYDDLNQLPLSA